MPADTHPLPNTLMAAFFRLRCNPSTEPKLPFAQQGLAALPHGTARPVQGKHHIPFLENGRFRGVDVLAHVFLGPQNSSGERHAFPVHIVNGEHQPVPEPGVQVPALSAVGKAGIYQNLVRKPLLTRPGQELP